MNATIAAQMTAADFLKLRKRRGTLIWALVLALAPLLIFFIVRAAQHSSTPLSHPRRRAAYHGFTDGLRILALFFGPLAAIMIGTDAGAGDASAGVFRDLVVTGRSRAGAVRLARARRARADVARRGERLDPDGDRHLRASPRARRPPAPHCSPTASASRCCPPASCAPSPSASPRSPPRGRPR